MAKLRRDKYGLYVITGGYLFRPTNHVRYGPGAKMRPFETKIKDGDVIKASHCNGSILAKVRTDTVSEYWESHLDQRRNKGCGNIAFSTYRFPIPRESEFFFVPPDEP